MTDSEILELARQAGLQKWADAYDPAVIAFARLVAAAEGEECIAIAFEQAERLAVADYGATREQAREWAKEDKLDSYKDCVIEHIDGIAAAIRSRTE